MGVNKLLKAGLDKQQNNLRSKLNNAEKRAEAIGNDAGENREEGIVLIPVSSLIDFPGNRDTSNTDIEILAEDILRNGFNGVIYAAPEYDTDPTCSDKACVPSDKRSGKPTGRYIIISGHRRVQALRKILEAQPDFDHGNVRVLLADPAISWDEMTEENILHNVDSRELKPSELRSQITTLLELYKKRGLSAEAISLTAEKLGIYKTKIYQENAIDRELSDALKTAYDGGQLNSIQAYTCAKLPGRLQDSIASYLAEGGTEVDAFISSLDINKRQLEYESLLAKNQELEEKIQSLSEIVQNGGEPADAAGKELRKARVYKKRTQDKLDRMMNEEAESPVITAANDRIDSAIKKIRKEIERNGLSAKQRSRLNRTLAELRDIL